MSHFYSSIWGARGEATRAGNRQSGIVGWVQGHGSRITARMWYDEHGEKDTGSIHIGTGHSNYSGGAVSFGLENLDDVVNSLDKGDKRINAIVARLHKEFAKLDEEAPKALKRIARKEKIERNRRERERKAEQKRLAAVRESITREEIRNFISLVEGYTPDRTNDEILEAMMDNYGGAAIERDENGFLIYVSRYSKGHTMYDLTTGLIIDKEIAAA